MVNKNTLYYLKYYDLYLFILTHIKFLFKKIKKYNYYIKHIFF